MLHVGVVVIAFLVLCCNSWAQEPAMRSGNDYQKACRLFISLTGTGRLEKNNFAESAQIGQCIGAIMAVGYLGRSLDPRITFCIPTEATLAQLTKMVLKYMDDHPAELHEEFPLLVLKTFRRAWPCQAPK